MLAVISVETSLIGMVLAIAAVILLGLKVQPRYAFLSGGLVGIGGLWLVGTLNTLPCQGSAAACGNPFPFIAISGGLVTAGLIAGIATALLIAPRLKRPRRRPNQHQSEELD